MLGIGTVLTPDVVAMCRAHRHPDAGSDGVTAKVAGMRTTIIHRKADAPSITVLGSIEEVEARLAAVREDDLVEFDTVPPGIPVLVPGQVITRDIVTYLVGLLRSQNRVELHGIVYDGYLPCLRVLTTAEEKGLRALA